MYVLLSVQRLAPWMEAVINPGSLYFKVHNGSSLPAALGMAGDGWGWLGMAGGGRGWRGWPHL